jgi:phage terminase large subunit GpA-like protein
VTDALSLESYIRTVSRSLTANFATWSKMPPEEWPESVYRLPNGGRFKWSYAPYIRRIFLSFFERQTIETVLMMYSRGLKSTAVLLLIGYLVDQAPRRMLSLWPTNSQAEKWSKDVLVGELFDTTDCLSHLGSKNAKRDGKNTILHKAFAGGLIDIFGANAPGDMRRAKGSLLYGDEIDAIDTTETDEGDQLAIFSKRGDEYPDTIRVYASYPSLKGHSRIDAKLQESDYNQWFSTCVVCGGEPFVMHRSQLRFDKDKPAGALLECPRCTAMLTDAQRYEMAHRQGFDNWKPQREFRGRRGFHANALLWPHPIDLVKYPGGFLQLLAQQVIDAENSDNPSRSKRVLVNTVDAECFIPDEKAEIPPDWMHLLTKREDYADEKRIILPNDALYMTAGVDMQEDRLEVSKLAWGREEEAWGVEHVVIPGSTKEDSTWDALEHELLREYDRADGTKLAMGFALCDAGHSAERLLRFIGRLHQKQSPLLGRFRACRGASQYPHPVIDYRYKILAKQLKGHWVGTDEAKDILYARLKLPEPGPGYFHHGKNWTEGQFKQLVAEKMTVGFERGQETRRFKNEDHVRNEVLDCRVYAFAALRLRRPNYDAIEAAFGESVKPKEEKEVPEAPQVQRPSFVGVSAWRI